ncbi:hypothetical protein QYM36_010542, partial [Artemia franciscana]
MDMFNNGGMFSQAAQSLGASQFLNPSAFGGLAPFLGPDASLSPMNGLFQTLMPSGLEGGEAAAEENDETIVVVKKKPEAGLLLGLLGLPIAIAVITVVVVAVTNVVVVVVANFFPDRFPRRNDLERNRPAYERKYMPKYRPAYETKYKPEYDAEYKPSYRRRRTLHKQGGSQFLNMFLIEELAAAVRDILSSEQCVQRALCDSAAITSALPGMRAAFASFSTALPGPLKWMGDIVANARNCK